MEELTMVTPIIWSGISGGVVWLMLWIGVVDWKQGYENDRLLPPSTIEIGLITALGAFISFTLGYNSARGLLVPLVNSFWRRERILE